MAKTKNTALSFMTQTGMSKFKEQFSEYFFLKDMMMAAAAAGTSLVVSRSDYDAFGFDLQLSIRSTNEEWQNVRIQLKSTYQHNKWDVHKSLLKDSEGRVIIIVLRSEGELIIPTYYLFNRAYTAIALARKPKVEHSGKCQVNLSGGEFIAINDNMLSIFDE